jgi:DNA recombination protein RmuC
MIQRKYRVVIAGPTTLWSILNSLQMGFRTLAIERRSSDVWNLLSAVKMEFGKYGDVLAKVQKKLQEASNTVDSVAVRSRAIQRKLKDVEELPGPDVENALMLADVGGDDEQFARATRPSSRRAALP